MQELDGTQERAAYASLTRAHGLGWLLDPAHKGMMLNSKELLDTQRLPCAVRST